MHILKSVGVVVVVLGLFAACRSTTLVGGSEVGMYQLLPISQSEGVRLNLQRGLVAIPDLNS
jgi:hypothetical protein